MMTLEVLKIPGVAAMDLLVQASIMSATPRETCHALIPCTISPALPSDETPPMQPPATMTNTYDDFHVSYESNPLTRIRPARCRRHHRASPFLFLSYFSTRPSPHKSGVAATVAVVRFPALVGFPQRALGGGGGRACVCVRACVSAVFPKAPTYGSNDAEQINLHRSHKCWQRRSKIPLESVQYKICPLDDAPCQLVPKSPYDQDV
jgi:hypothetical protein